MDMKPPASHILTPSSNSSEFHSIGLSVCHCKVVAHCAQKIKPKKEMSIGHVILLFGKLLETLHADWTFDVFDARQSSLNLYAQASI